MVNNSRHRAYCFTVNNYTSSDHLSCEQLKGFSKYFIVGKEVGEKGTPHLQGYVHFENPRTFDFMKRYLPRAHIEVANGSDQQNRAYCMKEGDYDEFGEPGPGQGKRMDLKEVADVIKSGKLGIDEFMFEYPEVYFKYSRAVEKMYQAMLVPRAKPPEVHWRWGLAGTGKTRFCIEKHPNHYIKDGTPWWDGYKQQEAIIIDDFDNQIPYRTLLRMLDRYVYQGQVKGGYVHINSPYIYITSEYPPERYWTGNEYAQVERRLTSVQEIK